jgi:dTDP-4-dehydrorhamnose 3,5-epimerase
MTVTPTGFESLLILEPKVIGDHRGYFMEAYNRQVMASLGVDIDFIQDNQSKSRKGVLRGLHFQVAPHAQSKLIRVLSGSILDVVVDLRRDQPTYSNHFSIELSSENMKQLLVPKGFAHGFVVLSDEVEVLYKCDEYYFPASERGIAYNDSALGIDWMLRPEELILSERDKSHPKLADFSEVF